MITAYRALAYLVCLLVGVQAATHAWSSAGIGKYVADGGVIDKSAMQPGGVDFPEVAGFIIHGINGMMLIPAVGVVLLVVGLIARFGGAVRWAAIVLVLIAVQVTLGMFGHGLTLLALLHGLNAVILFGAALLAGQRASRAGSASVPTHMREPVAS